jgi:hypothetical protein
MNQAGNRRILAGSRAMKSRGVKLDPIKDATDSQGSRTAVLPT